MPTSIKSTCMRKQRPWSLRARPRLIIIDYFVLQRSRRRGHPRVAISTVPDPSGSGRVYMLTSSVAAARAAVATREWVESKHDMYLIRGSVGAQAIFLPDRRRMEKKKKKHQRLGTGYLSPQHISTLTKYRCIEYILQSKAQH